MVWLLRMSLTFKCTANFRKTKLATWEANIFMSLCVSICTAYVYMYGVADRRFSTVSLAEIQRTKEKGTIFIHRDLDTFCIVSIHRIHNNNPIQHNPVLDDYHHQ